MKYNAPPPPIQSHSRVTDDLLKDFYVNYMKVIFSLIQSDNLGMIANSHVAFADSEPYGVRSAKCMALAELHSTAVDFCKTGVPAVMDRRDFRIEEYPSFMENTHRKSYESKKILGQIYKRVKSTRFQIDHQITETEYYDENLTLSGYEDYLQEAENLCEAYNKELWNIMESFEVLPY